MDGEDYGIELGKGYDREQESNEKSYKQPTDSLKCDKKRAKEVMIRENEQYVIEKDVKIVTKETVLVLGESEEINYIYLIFKVLPIQKGIKHCCQETIERTNDREEEEEINVDGDDNVESKLNVFFSDVSVILPHCEDYKTQDISIHNENYYIFGTVYNNNVLNGFSCAFEYKKYIMTEKCEYIYQIAIRTNQLKMIHKNINTIMSLQSIATHKYSTFSCLHQIFSIGSQKITNFIKSVSPFHYNLSTTSELGQSIHDNRENDNDEMNAFPINNTIIIDMDDPDENDNSINIVHGHSVEVVCLLLQNSLNILKNVIPHDLTPNNLWTELCALRKKTSSQTTKTNKDGDNVCTNVNTQQCDGTKNTTSQSTPKNNKPYSYSLIKPSLFKNIMSS